MEAKLEQINAIVNPAVFVLTIILQTAFFIRFKFKADSAAILILLTNLVVMGARILLAGELY